MDDDTEGDPRTAAIRRIRDKRDLWTHLFIYVAVNTMLVIIWALSTGGYFWPMWSIMGWGIGLAAHAWSIYGAGRAITEEQIQAEIDKTRPGS
ncbi:MAG: 2TM domain-containing protein [Acidimicrobiia bacterium]|nr:2TM domain-containing protein [Acidimicrobiia bacterium]